MILDCNISLFDQSWYNMIVRSIHMIWFLGVVVMRKDYGYQRDFWEEKTRDQEVGVPNTESNSMKISIFLFLGVFIGGLILYFLLS